MGCLEGLCRGPCDEFVRGVLADVQTFVAAMDSMFGGFRTRADATYKLLQAPGTAFLVVAAPESCLAELERRRLATVERWATRERYVAEMERRDP